jgi:hypothetical protein
MDILQLWKSGQGEQMYRYRRIGLVMLALVAVAVITTGTPMQPFTADAASPGALLQTLVIPNDKPVKVESMPFQAGRWYEIEAIGAFSDWDFRKDAVDAIWRYADKDFGP